MKGKEKTRTGTATGNEMRGTGTGTGEDTRTERKVEEAESPRCRNLSSVSRGGIRRKTRARERGGGNG